MVTPSRIVEGTPVTTAFIVLFTSPANTSTLIKKLTFTNTSASAALQVSVYLVASGGSAGSANMIRNAKTLAPLETFECYEAENQVLAPGDQLTAYASALGITAHGSGLLITQ